MVVVVVVVVVVVAVGGAVGVVVGGAVGGAVVVVVGVAVVVGGAGVVVVVVGVAVGVVVGVEIALRRKENKMFNVGESYFIRTVTYHLVGEVAAVNGNFMRLENASWVADSGRFMQAIHTGTLAEVEPVGDAIVNIDAIVDAFPWKHALPTEQK